MTLSTKFPLLLLCICLLLLNGCSSNSSTGDNPEPEPPASQFSITFSEGAGQPFDAVQFSGMPGAAEESMIYAVYRTENSSESFQTLIYKEEGKWLMRIPMHPINPTEGGTVEISIQGEDGTESGWEPFDIEAMPESEGSFRNLSNGLSALLTKYLDVAGTSRTVLNNTEIADLDAFQLPLYLAYSIIDMPDNENNITRIADGTAPVLTEENISLDLLDAAIQAMGMQQHIDLALQSIDSLSLKKRTSPSHHPQKRGTYFSAGNANQTATIDAELLSDLMWAQQYADIYNNKYGQQIMNTAGQGIAVLTILAPPPQKVVGGVASAAMFGITTIIDAVQNIYPAKFIHRDNDFRIQPTNFPEDSDGGSWSLNVVAESNGWSVEKAALNGLLQIVGAKGAKNIENPILQPAIREYGEDVVNALVGEGLQQLINLSTFGDSSDGVLRIGPEQWTSNVTELSKISVVEGEAVKVDQVRFDGISTNEIGTARVRGEKKEGYFAYQALLRFKNVEVHAIDMQVMPNKIFVEPGDDAFFDVSVDWANDKSLKWSATAGKIAGGAGEQLSATLTTPKEPWKEPITVRATSTSTGGLRAPSKSPPPREVVALVYTDEVEITIIPGSACVKKGESLTFQAEVIGVDGEPDIDWSASAGTFNGSTYIAPGSDVGNVTITATLQVEGTEISNSITIRVGKCLCYWEASFSGSLSGTSEGEYAVFESIQAEKNGTQFTFWPKAEENRPAFFATHVPQISSGFTGSLETLVTLILKNSDWVSIEDPQYEIQLPQNSISSNDGNRISGTISGQLVQFDTTQNPPAINFAGFTLNYVSLRKTSSNPNPCE